MLAHESPNELSIAESTRQVDDSRQDRRGVYM